MLAASILLEIVALVLFLVAGDVVALAAARLLQGVATGAAITTLGATLVDLEPAHAARSGGRGQLRGPPAGLALGALGCGALVEFGPAPTRFVYAAAHRRDGPRGGRRRSACGRRHRGGRERSPRCAPASASPARLRTDAVPVVPVMIASWALGGLYLSLGPSVTAGLFGLRNHLVGGVVVTLLCGTAAVAAFLLRSRPATSLLAPASRAARPRHPGQPRGRVDGPDRAVRPLGTLIAGVGFGAAALATFGTFARIAEPHERGALFAAAFVISYVAFSVPACSPASPAPPSACGSPPRSTPSRSSPPQPPPSCSARRRRPGRQVIAREEPARKTVPVSASNTSW